MNSAPLDGALLMSSVAAICWTRARTIFMPRLRDCAIIERSRQSPALIADGQQHTTWR
jgi:hypothetical protein